MFNGLNERSFVAGLTRSSLESRKMSISDAIHHRSSPPARSHGLGPVMVDLQGEQLSGEERELLMHPAVGGVILFSRNFSSPEQVAGLIQDIHSLRDPHLLVAVDQEGGRVQRFREGFTPLPPIRRFGEIYDRHPDRARDLAHAAGWLMARELRAVGVDFSFAPVLDLDRGVSSVIGDRAFHADPKAVVRLALAWQRGMREAGMPAVGKHFPGHGAVAADSHVDVPVDERPFETILAQDVVPFAQLVENGLAAVMTAHVIYEKVDHRPATFSSFWITEVLRKRLGFQGAVFSDDLGMVGAGVVGGMLARAEAALEAGCDMVPVCNDPAGAREVVENLRWRDTPLSHLRLARMHGRPAPPRQALLDDPRWRRVAERVARLVREEGEPGLPY